MHLVLYYFNTKKMENVSWWYFFCVLVNACNIAKDHEEEIFHIHWPFKRGC